MLYETKFNPQVDMREPEFLEESEYCIAHMLEARAVSGSNSGGTGEYNGIEDPNKIIGRVNDVFSAMDASRVTARVGQVSKSE